MPSEVQLLRRLIERAQTGDGEAMGQLLLHKVGDLRRFLRLRRQNRKLQQREADSDLIQSIYLAAFRGIGTFNYAGDKSFRNWLLGIATNVLKEHLRDATAGKRDVGREFDGPVTRMLAEVTAAVTSPSQNAIAEEALVRLEEAFAKLSEQHQEVILLSQYQGLSSDQVAERMGSTPAAVRQMLVRARLRLAGLLDRGPAAG